MIEPTINNILSLSDGEFEIIKKNCAYLAKLKKEQVFITNGRQGQLPFNVGLETLKGLTAGEDFNKKKTKTAGDLSKQKEVYKKIVLSIVRICSGLSTISLGLHALEETNEDTFDQRNNALAHLLKAFHQVRHGIIWDKGDECDNNTQPTQFFYTDFKEKKLHDSSKDGAHDGTTGWSKDDLEDKGRIKHPLLMQLYQEAGIGESNFEKVFPILYSVDAEISIYMKALHSKLQTVEGTNKLLNKVRDTNLHQYSLGKGIPTIPHYRKKDWAKVMKGGGGGKEEKKNKLKGPRRMKHSNNSNTNDGELINTPETDCEVSDHHRLLSSFNNMPYSPPCNIYQLVTGEKEEEN